MSALKTLLLLAPLTLACSEATDWPAETPVPTPTTLQTLQRGAELSFDVVNSAASIAVHWKGGSSTSSSTALSPTGGGLYLLSDDLGNLELSAFELALGDFVISGEQLPSDIHLSDISLYLQAPVSFDSVEWSEDRMGASAELEASLMLDWSLITSSGESAPLGAQELTELPLQITVDATPEGMQLSLEVAMQGPVWSWLGVVELRDLQLSLRN